MYNFKIVKLLSTITYKIKVSKTGKRVNVKTLNVEL